MTNFEPSSGSNISTWAERGTSRCVPDERPTSAMRSLESCFDTTCLFNCRVSACINLIKPVSNGANIKMSADMAIKALETSLGKIVLIKLKGGKVIRGSLQGFDQHMNLSLESAEEIVADGKSTSMGTLIVRGDNIIMISPPTG